MGNEELDKKVMWYEVYRDLAVLLAKIDGEELYEKCLDKDSGFQEKFRGLHLWTKKFIEYKHKEKLETLDPMHVFASINSSRMREELRLQRINLYFEILDKGNPKEKYSSIDFTGCPSPVTISLMAARNEKSQKEIWQVFREIIDKKYDKKSNYFKKLNSWYGIAIESFTILLFWIDAQNFLPLDKNTVALLQKYDKLIETPTDWKSYLDLLKIEKKDSYLHSKFIYINLARTAWTGHIEIRNQEMKKDLENYLSKKDFNATTSQTLDLSNDKLEEDFRLIGIHLLEDYKGLSPNWYMLDNAFKVIDDEKIEYDKEKDINLFDKKDMSLYKKRINITAIVGKNGTGKSSLVELLLKTIQDTIHEELNIEYIFKNGEYLYKVNKFSKVNKYEIDDDLYHIRDEEIEFKDTFLNILMNYSIHGLNSKHEGNKWINNNKIIIEPERNDGNIDINEETIKLKKRLIIKLLEPEVEGKDKTKESSLQLTDTLKVTYVKDVNQNEYDIYNLRMSVEKARLDNNNEKLSISEILDVDKYKDVLLGDEKILFDELSSGEKQKIYSINSILYYIEKSSNKNINLFLDEIELYFHPEFQRRYIYELLEELHEMDLRSNNLNINIIFITHSPFILSDIPESKILFLDKESADIRAKTVPQNNGVKTFGANIHTLLSDSFFMESGLIGEFAKNKIKKILKQLNDHKEKEKLLTEVEQQDIKKVIQAIGEPFLNQKLWNMYQSLFNDIDAEKKRLNEEMNRIKEKIKGLKK